MMSVGLNFVSKDVDVAMPARMFVDRNRASALPDLSQISVPSYEASRYATEALAHCKVIRVSVAATAPGFAYRFCPPF
jgi:hypothetical protein